MQKIVVPQFLTVENTILGPITVRQFLEMLVGGLTIAIFYRIFDFSLFLVSSLGVVVVVVILAFVKPNGQNFHIFLLNYVVTFRNPKLKVWRRSMEASDLTGLKKSKTKPKAKTTPTEARRPITASRLSELSLIVDTGGNYQGENGSEL